MDIQDVDNKITNGSVKIIYEKDQISIIETEDNALT